MDVGTFPHLQRKKGSAVSFDEDDFVLPPLFSTSSRMAVYGQTRYKTNDSFRLENVITYHYVYLSILLRRFHNTDTI
jgi:hypothetical protein